MELIRTIADGMAQEEGLLFFPEECETIAVNCVRVDEGHRTDPAVHPDEEEIYVIAAGQGAVILDGVRTPVRQGDVVYIPRHTEHIVEGEKGGLTYVCVANWPDMPGKIPRDPDKAARPVG